MLKQKTSSSPALPSEGAGRGGLLAQIQLGTSLKKVNTVEKSCLLIILVEELVEVISPPMELLHQLQMEAEVWVA